MSQETIKKCPYCDEDLPHHKNCAAYACAWPPFTDQETIKLDDLKCVELRKNDTLMVRLPGRAPQAHVAHMAEQLRHAFPSNEIVILASGVEVFVVSPGEKPPDIVADFEMMQAMVSDRESPENQNGEAEIYVNSIPAGHGPFSRKQWQEWHDSIDWSGFPDPTDAISERAL